MNRRLLSALHLTLIAALLVSGLPAHALVDATPAAAPDLALDEGDSQEPEDGGCPHHAQATADPGADAVPEPVDPTTEDCCGPDCRCACAGLTLVLLPSTVPLATTPPTRHGSRSSLILPSMPGSALLRPPQY
jgi:hypothetical protein